MNQALYAAVSGASNSQMRLDVLTHNLSNVNTVGFKEDKLYFHVPDREEDSRMSRKAAGFTMSPPSEPYETRTDFTPSPLRPTNNVLDMALEGEGFFCVQTPEGKQYTRRGDFSLTQGGKLITKAGYPVLGKNGEIVLRGKNITVNETGEISVDGNPVDTLQVVGIGKPETLQKVGGTLFRSPGGQVDEKEVKNLKIKQGFLETSGVNGVKTMTEMIDVLRGYESYQKIIHFLSDVSKKSINDVGRLA
ncbi:MAG: flagellar basal-body rod protein FlgF [Deltaproteobacteria bacterium]|nr:flagellar basal-body rod protein FlgF [Deltaproteobacteria bacterium]